MNQLPDALAPLAQYKQFVLYQLVPKDNGKMNKVPVSPITLEPVSAHDPKNWLSFDDAVQYSISSNDYGVGFAFTLNDPFWFLDIDACLENGQWSELANCIMACLPGCAIEVSQSGTGLHLIGSGTCPPHSCKDGSLNIEFYTEGRFVALTGINAIGNAATDCTEYLPAVVNTWFPPVAENKDGQTEWTTSPVPEWTGSTDDDELIKKALKSGGVRAALGAAVSFSDLWEKNEESLGGFYPDPEQGRTFDASQADAALAQHLAFWTGKDCERMERLMRASGLAREKWDRREGGGHEKKYLSRTIIRACSRQKEVYNRVDRTGAQVNITVDNTPDLSVNPEYTVGPQFIPPGEQMVEYFQGMVYVASRNTIWSKRHMAEYKPETFKNKFGGFTFGLEIDDAKKTTDDAFKAFTLNQSIRFPKVDGICFRPQEPSGKIYREEGHPSLVNVYVPIETPSTPGDVTPFLVHLQKLLPDDRDREILLSYMAAITQYPGVKFRWCPVIQGTEGNGKSLLKNVIIQAISKQYYHDVNPSSLMKGGLQFNSWAANKLFISVEEIYISDRRHVMEALKPYISNDELEIQGKGVNQYVDQNLTNWMMFTNHKDGVPVTENNRRYAMLFTAQQSKDDLRVYGMAGNYFPDLWKWMESGGYSYITHYLKNYQIKDEFNPATMCLTAPTTTSTVEAVSSSLGVVEQNILQAVEEERVGFKGGWVSSIKVSELIKSMNLSSKISPQKQATMMRELGYIRHPHLPEGKVTTCVVMEGSKRPKLYIKKSNTLLSQLTNSKVIVDRYCKDQGYISPQPNTETDDVETTPQ